MARLNLLHRALFWTLMCLLFLVSASEGINSTAGQNVTLTCRAANNSIIIVEWSRADLKTEHVLVYRDGHFVPDQHPSFKNRVDLQDRQMKDGDASLILKDVMINDAGTYECRVFMEETRSWKSISSSYLSVVPPGQTGGHTEDGVGRGHFGLIAGLIFVAAVVGFLIYRTHQQQNQDSFQPPGEKQPCCYY